MLTPWQYIEIERNAERKSEYYAGEMFEMAGANEAHGLISGNLLALLHTRLRRSACRPFVSDLRVNVPATGLYTYPDIVVASASTSSSTQKPIRYSTPSSSPRSYPRPPKPMTAAASSNTIGPSRT